MHIEQRFERVARLQLELDVAKDLLSIEFNQTAMSNEWDFDHVIETDGTYKTTRGQVLDTIKENGSTYKLVVYNDVSHEPVTIVIKEKDRGSHEQED